MIFVWIIIINYFKNLMSEFVVIRFIAITTGSVIIMELINDLRRKNFVEHFIIITIIKVVDSPLKILCFGFIIKLIKLKVKKI
jgi:hypothetical protein